MAERRMFAKTIVDSDAFLDMPLSTQALYFHLNLRADDDGFVNSPKKVQRLVSCSDDDLKLLLAKRFILAFDSGVVVIKHWKLHNYIRKDRYVATMYQEEMATLAEKENGSYTECQPLGLPDGNQRLTQVRLGKDRIGKVSKDIENGADKPPIFIPPTVDEVREYCIKHNYSVDAEAFVAFYYSKGWMVGKNKMKKWTGAVVTWEQRNKQNMPKQSKANGGLSNVDW